MAKENQLTHTADVFSRSPIKGSKPTVYSITINIFSTQFVFRENTDLSEIGHKTKRTLVKGLSNFLKQLASVVLANITQE